MVMRASKVARFLAPTVLGAALLAMLSAPLTALPAAADTAATASVSVERACNAPKPGFRACLALRVVTPAVPAGQMTPFVTPSGFGPTDLSSAYALPATGGTGVTVAIVDAMDQPNAEADLATYRSQYGLPACTTANGCFRKVNQTGAASPLPAADAGWGEEIDLDIEMVSAVCPSCKIILAEATSASTANLGKAVNAAASLGANVISNSYGGGESSSDPTTTSSYYNHPGILITASSGDDGYGVEYPAAATTVLSVGGTSLARATNARGWTETVWGSTNNANGGAGSGCSTVETKPSWQHDTGCTRRTVADVSAVANPSTGVAVYDAGSGGWLVFGGTSVASPVVASVYALTGHASATPQFPYANAGDQYDVTSGANGSCGGSYLCTGAVGYDGPTGLGTPNGTAMAGGTVPTNDFSVAVSPTSGSVTAGGSTAATASTATVSGSAQTVSFSASGLPAGASAAFSPASVTSGSSSTMTITTTTATAGGTYPVTITGTGTSGTHSATFSLVVTAAGSGGCTASQLLGNPGFESGNTIWAASTGVIDGTTSGSAPHSGTFKAWLDGYGSTHTDTLSQSVTIPAGTCTPTFSFWLKITTAETTTTTAFDKLTVKVTNTAGTTLATLATYSNLNKGTAYALKSFDLSAYKGQTVKVNFTGVEDSSLQTSFFVDDTGVNLA